MKLNCIEKYINFVPINTLNVSHQHSNRMKLSIALFLLIPLVSGCQKSKGFHEIYLKDRIHCDSKVNNCPKGIFVLTENKKTIDENSTFTFQPIFDENDKGSQKLEYEMGIDWCSSNTFDKEKTHVKVSVRKPLPNSHPFIMMIIIAFIKIIMAFIVIMFLSSISDDPEAPFFALCFITMLLSS